MSKRMSFHAALWAGLGLAIMVLAAAGCGSKGASLGAVKGQVTKDGKPVANATLMFIPKEKGAASGGQTDASGHFELKFSDGRPGALPGKHRVVITLPGEEAPPPMGGPPPAAAVPRQGPMEFSREAEVKGDGPTDLSFDLTK